MASNDALTRNTHTTITVDGQAQPFRFTNLNLAERLADVGQFSFSWHTDTDDGSLSAAIKFKDDNLSKEVNIKFADENGAEKYSFKGVITQVDSAPSDDAHLVFRVAGSGAFVKMSGVHECRSFYHKTLSDVLGALPANGEQTSFQPVYTEDLYYTVQYNQTDFDFIRSLAARYGEWLYYSKDKLVFGAKPSGSAVTVLAGRDIENIQVHAHAIKGTDASTGFDIFTGKPMTASGAVPAPSSSPLLAAAGKGAGNLYTNNTTGTHFPGAATQSLLTLSNKLQQQSATAGSVYISASSRLSELSVGSVISVTDAQDSGGKQFIIIDIGHTVSGYESYSNYFTAIPADVEAPPYTNPWLYPTAGAQPALVKENEDKDGHDRIRVHFPWMAESEMTPWIQVLTPYAGKNKGMRFIPEKEEEVMIDFIDNNAERPVMVGAVFTDQNQSAVDVKNNSIKSFGTASGRHFAIDDDNGIMRMYDNFNEKTPKNGIMMKQKDSDNMTLIESQAGTDDYSVIALKNKESLNLGVLSGGSIVVEIKMEAESKKITIHSTGSIELNADQSITLNSATINIKGSQEVNIEGTSGGVNIKGMKIAAKADTNVEVEAGAELKMKGAMGSISADAMMEVKSSGITSIGGSLVKIN